MASFTKPVEIKAAPGFRNLMFVVEQEGRVMVLRKGNKLRKPFLNLKGRVQSGGERGLLSIGFPPGYRKSKRFYVYYTDRTGDIKVDEFRRRSPVKARPNSRRSVITIPHRENSNHNGGQLQFLGKYLYFGTGDGGGGGDVPGNAQNRNILLGKMIKIDPRASKGRPYRVPRSNPYVGRNGRNEIYAIGLRNPFRWSFQKTGGVTRMVIADVGESGFEEINAVPVARANGGNFGWNRFEGFQEFKGSIPGTIKPKLVLPHSKGYCSVIGGLVVRDRKVPALRGRYLFSDFCKSDVRSFRLTPRRVRTTRATGLSESSISSFAESASRTVYATSLAGPVFRLTQ
ncbi:MAG: PQQ-dependent sugar dehydrogenase [Actinomycetota bacterium]|nr:PQQ-dependent sugar dehydrogenase [Actinomycetota bacterium]